MPRRRFSVPSKAWLLPILACALVTILSHLSRDFEWERRHQFNQWFGFMSPPAMGYFFPKAGGTTLVSTKETPRKITLDGKPWELREFSFSRHDNQEASLMSHARNLRGYSAGAASAALPEIRSVPHLRISAFLQSIKPTPVSLNFKRLLIRDEQGFWVAPVTYQTSTSGQGSARVELGYPLPATSQPTALGWCDGSDDENTYVYYRGDVYLAGFFKRYGVIYVETDPAGADVSCFGNFWDRKGADIDMETREGRFYLAGVDMREWTERHKQDRGFGNARVLIRFPQREAARKAATSSAQ